MNQLIQCKAPRSYKVKQFSDKESFFTKIKRKVYLYRFDGHAFKYVTDDKGQESYELINAKRFNCSDLGFVSFDINRYYFSLCPL